MHPGTGAGSLSRWKHTRLPRQSASVSQSPSHIFNGNESGGSPSSPVIDNVPGATGAVGTGAVGVGGVGDGAGRLLPAQRDSAASKADWQSFKFNTHANVKSRSTARHGNVTNALDTARNTATCVNFIVMAPTL